jgi:hypothetical protein
MNLRELIKGIGVIAMLLLGIIALAFIFEKFPLLFITLVISVMVGGTLAFGIFVWNNIKNMFR